MEQVLIAIKIKYTGKGRKVVELPIPFVQKCEKTGEVICDPIGVFDAVNGLALLEINGPDGVFQEVERIYEDGPVETKSEAVVEVHPEYSCQCCGKAIPWKKQHEKTPPRFLVGHSMQLAARMKAIKEKQVIQEAPSPI